MVLKTAHRTYHTEFFTCPSFLVPSPGFYKLCCTTTTVKMDACSKHLKSVGIYFVFLTFDLMLCEKAVLLINCCVVVSAALKVMLNRICSPSTMGTRHPHSITFHVGYALHSQGLVSSLHRLLSLSNSLCPPLSVAVRLSVCPLAALCYPL